MRTAVSTRAFTPAATSAELSARLLITVASIPIWSPFTRSNPLLAPLSPRKMFPPPMTIPICTPNSWISLICAAYSARRFSSIPYCFSPIRLSPLSFNKIRLYVAIILKFVVFSDKDNGIWGQYNQVDLNLYYLFFECIVSRLVCYHSL